MRAIAYARVSTDDQARPDRTSLAQQHEACAALATRFGVTLEQWFEDAGVSGGTAEKRPGFMALVDFCRQHASDRRRVGLVLVLNDSRWGRFTDSEESTYWRVLLQKLGWHVRFAEGDDTDDPLARPILRSLHSGQASAYRRAIRDNARRGARGSAAAGYWQVEAPIGYRRMAIRPDGATRVLERGQQKADDERAKLTPGPDAEVQLIRRLFETYATGVHSFGTLLRVALAAMPAKKWSRPVIRAILTNPAYVGDVVWCRRARDEFERQRVQTNSAEWVVAREAHPALVSRETFAQVAEVLRRNYRARRLTAGGYALSGLITCGHCGEAFIGHGGPKGPPADPDRYRMYSHRSLGGRRAIDPKTRCPYVHGILPRRLLEPMVIGLVAEQLRDPRRVWAIEKAVDQAFTRLAAGSDGRREELERERGALLAQRDRLVNLAAQGVLTAVDIGGKVSELRAGVESIDLQLHQLRFAAARASGVPEFKDRVKAMALNFAATASKLTGSALRELLRPWIQSAVVDRTTDTLRVTFNPLPMIPDLAVVTTRGGPPNHFLKQRPVVRTISLPPIRVQTRRAAGGAR